MSASQGPKRAAIIATVVAAILVCASVVSAGPGLQTGGLTGNPNGSGCTNCLVDDGGFNVVGNYLPIDGGTVTGSLGVRRGTQLGNLDAGPALIIETGNQSNGPGLKLGPVENYGYIQIGNASTTYIQGNSSSLFLSSSVWVNFSGSNNGARSNGNDLFVAAAGNFLDSNSNKSTYSPAALSARLIQSGSGAAVGGALAVTFPTPFSVAPNCTCAHTNAAPLACGISTAATTSGVTFTVVTGGTDVIQWICMGAR